MITLTNRLLSRIILEKVMIFTLLIVITISGCNERIVYEKQSKYPAMVLVQGGTFSPGTNYRVTLSSFYISKYEVTQAQWTAVMGGNYDHDWDRGQGPTHPAYRVSWFDAVEYCNRLSIREGLTPAYSYSTHGTNPSNWPSGWNTSNGNHTNVSCNWNANGYRLPTEMEWEFTARGGVPAQQAGTFNTTYSGSNNLENVAWYGNNSGGKYHPVGSKRANELGIYDMSGNVLEWCWDISGGYPTGVHNNPKGPSTGQGRILRGGSIWWHIATNFPVYNRFSRDPVSRSYMYGGPYGFRVSRTQN